MTGNTAPPRRKIQALTVSVNYADFLECIAPNLRHFERWLVVTDEKDTRTQEVCRRHGMDVLFSKRLYEMGAAFHKAAALNEGLEALDQDGWVAVMDSDILLPRDFRERLDAQDLDPAGLYGLAGRRVCPTLAEFRALAAHEPWADNLIYTTFVIGYFNLFHLGQERNRYPDHGSDDASTYDVLFSEAFPPAQRHYLPMVCLHAGDASQNWRGRTTDPFFDHPGELGAGAESSAEQIAERLGGPDKHAALLGCWRGGPARVLARYFGEVTVIDHWGLYLRAVTPVMQKDLAVLQSQYAAETAGLSTLSQPREHSEQTLASIPDASLDVLWLTAEPEYDSLLQLLPRWLPKLKPGGAVVGGFYDPDLLPGPSQLVHLLLGTPDVRCDDLQWVKHLSDPAGHVARLLPARRGSGSRGVVYVATGPGDVEALLVSLHSLRRHWQGPVCVLNAGDELGPLCVACARLGVDFRNVPAVSEASPPDLLTLYALDWSPFDESLFLNHATLVLAPVERLFDSRLGRDHILATSAHRLSEETPALVWQRHSAVLDTWRSLALMMQSDFGHRAVSAARGLVVHDGRLCVRPGEAIWNGPARRAPAECCVLSLARLARAGTDALRMLPAWFEEEQALLRLLQLT
jgi:hypothetical protein